MRDIILVGVVGVGLLLVFWRPVIGAYLWAWLSIMNPHKMAFGFAATLPLAAMAAALTLLMLPLTSQRRPLPLNTVTICWLLLVVWMSLTSVFAINLPELVFDRWVFVMKIHLMMAVTLMLVIDAKQLRTLVAVVTLSLAFFGIKGGVFTILTGGTMRVWGPPQSLVFGNNELAVGLVIVVPFLYWMRQVSPNRWIRHGLALSIALCALSILGTQSRGALLALVAMAFVLGLKSSHRLQVSIGTLGLVALAIAFMPDSWSDRMDTISGYQGDMSAMSRLWTWNTLWNVAVDRPLVGAGFRADNPIVFSTYAPRGGEWAIFDGYVWVAHSIYFEMLGEQGFVGLALFLGLWVATWRLAGRTARRALDLDEFKTWVPLLMNMCQVSILGYAVGGAFLSLAQFDVPYYVMGFVLAADRLVRAPVAATDKDAAPAIKTAAARSESAT